MPRKTSLSEQKTNASPDYVGLVKFLIEPFLEDPESLYIDCENLDSNQKVWLRVAFDVADKGKVFGRGGRNIQAVRTVIQTAAAVAGQSIYLDIYSDSEDKPSFASSNNRKSPHPKRKQKPMRKSRSRHSQTG